MVNIGPIRRYLFVYRIFYSLGLSRGRASLHFHMHIPATVLTTTHVVATSIRPGFSGYFIGRAWCLHLGGQADKL
jgi:hypothetical protein